MYRFALRTVAAVALLAFTFLAPAARAQAEVGWVPLVSPAGLITAVAREPVQIIDIRASKDTAKGTVPGAVWLPFAEWRAAAAPGDRVIGEAELEGFLGAAGISPDAPVAIFHQSGHPVQMGRAAIVYWLLKTAGFERIAILDGGYKSWSGADLVTAEAHRVAEPVRLDLTYRYDWWADPLTVFGVASRQVEGHILDARFERQMRKAAETGKPILSVPEARYMPVSFILEFLSSDRMAPESHEAYRAELEARGVALGRDLVLSICQTGELSALSWFYASEVVGIDRVMYYPDAIKGWQADGGVLFGLRAEL